MIDQGRLITEAVSIPVIGDADNGYGNSMNVKRTVKGYINAGFAGMILEDQVWFQVITSADFSTYIVLVLLV
jgi:2-methylisocitrate lyase-like PEP mutase family enzyme